MKGIGLLIGIAAVSLVRGAPKMVANSMGFGFKDEFKLGGKTIRRPKHWNSKAHKKAFEVVGRYISDPLTRDVMIVFQDKDLQDPKNFWGYNKVPLEVWHEVLDFFRDEGVIEQRWCLQIPLRMKKPDYITKPDWKPEDHMMTPQHDAYGNEIKHAEQGFFGTIVNSVEWNPGLLTDQQKNELVGFPYAIHRTKYAKEDDDQSEHIIVGDRYLHRIFVRNRSILNDENLKDGAKRLHTFLSAAAEAEDRTFK